MYPIWTCYPWMTIRDAAPGKEYRPLLGLFQLAILSRIHSCLLLQKICSATKPWRQETYEH